MPRRRGRAGAPKSRRPSRREWVSPATTGPLDVFFSRTFPASSESSGSTPRYVRVQLPRTPQPLVMASNSTHEIDRLPSPPLPPSSTSSRGTRVQLRNWPRPTLTNRYPGRRPIRVRSVVQSSSPPASDRNASDIFSSSLPEHAFPVIDDDRSNDAGSDTDAAKIELGRGVQTCVDLRAEFTDRASAQMDLGLVEIPMTVEPPTSPSRHDSPALTDYPVLGSELEGRISVDIEPSSDACSEGCPPSEIFDVDSPASDLERETLRVSVHGDSPAGDDIADEREDIAKQLYTLLSQGIGACSDMEHFMRSAQHMQAAGDNHHPLSASYCHPVAGAGFSDVLRDESLRPPLDISRKAYPDHSTLEYLFHGTLGDPDVARNICLHEESPPPCFYTTSSDIDSFIAFPTSPAAFRQGFDFCPTNARERTIQSDTHIERSIEYLDPNGRLRRSTLPPMKIPHIYLGSIQGIKNCSVYIFFPRLYDASRPFVALTDKQATRFYDDVMWALLADLCPPDMWQHYPGSYGQSFRMAAARSTEMRTGPHSSNPRLQHGHFHVQAEILPELWRRLLDRVGEPSNHLGEFENPFLMVEAKGFKAQFKSSSGATPATNDPFVEAVDRFWATVRPMLDLSFIPNDDFYLDHAGEICPLVARSLEGLQNGNDVPQVFLHKRCCLESHLRRLYGYHAATGTVPGKHTFYPIHFLRDAANLTSVPPKKSALYQHGCRYIQYYCVFKEMWDGYKTFPFGNPNLEELALDPREWAGIAAATGHQGTRDRHTIVHGYGHSKTRVADSSINRVLDSFAPRVELRYTKTLSDAMYDYALRHPIPRSVVQTRGPPKFVWPVSTEHFVDYVRGNTNKFCSALEMISATSPERGIPWPRSQLMFALLKCLRVFFGQANLPMYPTLWADCRRDPESLVRRGLGFESTMRRTGYCWFLPVIDWQQLELREDIAPTFIVPRREIMGQTGVSRIIHNTNRDIDSAIQLLEQFADNAAARQLLLLLLAHLCFRQFRHDVLLAVSKDQAIAADIAKLVDADEVELCYDDIAALMIDQPSLVSGNRATNSTPLAIFETLWGDNKVINRKHWDNKPFRQMYRKVADIARADSCFDALFINEFFKHHWLLPWPDNNGSMISTAKKTQKRLWWSACFVDDVQQSKPMSQKVFWGRNSSTRGSVPPYPETLGMTLVQLRAHLHSVA